ncbi:MAG: NADH-quinone oxidoreductase subunit J [Planctomycetaceae bacterium]|nr:NADH-quinone oxidoreductase subunit J [Planctomycetaceae bacterium]
MTYEKLLFLIFALSTCGGALGVVLAQRVARMAFWLIVSLGSTAGLYFMLHADFVAATQIIIYVGGTLVLLIFGIMLTASGPHVNIQTSPGELVLGAGVGLMLLFLIQGTVRSVDWNQAAVVTSQGEFVPAEGQGYNPQGQGNTIRPLGMALLGLRPDKDLGAPEEAGLSSGYLFPFEIVSIHLLVVLVGASYLARAKRRAQASE